MHTYTAHIWTCKMLKHSGHDEFMNTKSSLRDKPKLESIFITTLENKSE